MIIAKSNSESCIKRLISILEKQYPSMPFELKTKHITRIGHTTIIEFPDDKIGYWEEANAGIMDRIERFCEGYVVGWEDHYKAVEQELAARNYSGMN